MEIAKQCYIKVTWDDKFSVFLLKIISCTCLLGSGLKLIFHCTPSYWFDTNHYLIHLHEVSTLQITEKKKYHLQTILYLMIGLQLDRWYKPKKEEDPKLIPGGLLHLHLSIQKLYFYLLKSKMKHWAVYQKCHFVLVST